MTKSSLIKKSILVTILAMISQVVVMAQEYSSYYQGKKVYYAIAPDRLVIKTKDNMALERLVKNPSSLHAFAQNIKKDSNPRVAIIELAAGKTKKDVQQALRDLQNRDDIELAAPMFVTEQGKAIGTYKNAITIQLKKSTSLHQVQALAERMRVTIGEQYKYDTRTYTVHVPKAAADPMAVANAFFETGLFEFAEPHFLLYIYKTSTNDEYSWAQWSHRNSGQYSGTTNADMNVPEAWTLPNTCLGSGVRVAVFDGGIQLDHEDLAANLLPGLDVTGYGTNGGIVRSEDDYHGTACAGIIAAVANNGKGIAGVAPNAKIVPVRVQIDKNLVDPLLVASAFDWVTVENKAEIISCSWEAYLGMATIEAAVNRALNNGRVRSSVSKGCVIVASAGNYNTDQIVFPASIEGVIAVGASNQCDKRKSPTDCSNRNGSATFNWGSNYGTGVDVVAPGIEIMTTDISDLNSNMQGMDAGNYGSFYGTSAAAPHVAGVMALILSANPLLTQQQARACLEQSADKIPGYQFNNNIFGQPNGSWNYEVGYGRVSALGAVLKALPAISSTLANPDHFCGSSATFSVTNNYNNIAVTWESSDPNTASIDPVTGVLTRVNDGYVTVLAHFNQSLCGATTLAKQIYVGDFANVLTVYQEPDGDRFCENSTIRYYVDETENLNLQYNWTISGQGTIIGYSNNKYVDVRPYNSSQNVSYTLSLQVTGGCPSTPIIGYDVVNPYQLYLDNCRGYRLAYYPNPSSNELIIEEENTSLSNVQQSDAVGMKTITPKVSASPATKRLIQSISKTSFEVFLYDNFGRLVLSGKSTSGKVVLPVSNIPNGLYTLRGGDNKSVISERIQIQH